MRFVRGSGGALRRLACLLIQLSLLAGSGPALAQQADRAGHPDGGQQARYRVINLGPGTIADYPHINARGQAAFSLIHHDRIAGFFYDGARVRTIGSLGGDTVYVSDLNDAGQVTGTSLNENGRENAFVWSAGGGMLDLRAQPQRDYSYGVAINNRGVVTGSFGESARPFRWSASSGVEDLGVTPGLPSPSSGRVLNDAGLIAGAITIDDERNRAFVWTRGGGLVDIDTLGSYESAPVAVGAGGEVAGNRLASPDDGGDRPFLWTAATGMVDLGIGRGTTAWVNAMTPGLHMAGVVGYGDGRQRAMSWTRAGGIRELGTLGGRTSVAHDVNSRGQIVGFAENSAGVMRAFVWSGQAGMRDLNRLLHRPPHGLVLDYAMAINDSGAIVASSNAGLVLLQPDRGSAGSGVTLGPVLAVEWVRVGAPLAVSVSFVDADRVGVRSIDWAWGDGSGGAARMTVGRDGTGSANASHSYALPGVYTVTATVVERGGRSIVVAHTVVVSAQDEEV